MSKLDKYSKLINKAFGKKSANLLSDSSYEKVECIPTGISVIDHFVFGCGGFPLKRVTELYAPEGAGKSSLALAAMAQAQQMGADVILCETEQAMPNEERFATFNVDPEKVLQLNADCIEDVFERLEVLLNFKIEQKDPTPTLFVWDSLAQTPTRGEIEQGLTGKQKVGDRAKFMSLAMRSLMKKIDEANCAVVIINQTRQNIGVMFGDNMVTPGGDAVKFASSLRVCLLGGTAVKDGTTKIGKDVTVFTSKNRMAPPSRKTKVRFLFDTGWDERWSLLYFTKDVGLTKPRQKKYDFEEIHKTLDECRWNPSKVKEYLKDKGANDDAETDGDSPEDGEQD